MKKICLMVVAMLLVSIFSAFAEGIDLSGMTTEELINFEFRIKEELKSRDQLTDGYLYQGVYTIGEDLEEGRYVFRCEKYIENKREYGEIYLSRSHERPQGTRMQIGDEWSARLKEGDTLALTFIECMLTRID